VCLATPGSDGAIQLLMKLLGHTCNKISAPEKVNTWGICYDDFGTCEAFRSISIFVDAFYIIIQTIDKTFYFHHSP